MKKNNNIKNLTSPVVSYFNMDANKGIIYKDNKGKSGVYRINNEINGKSYIGSSINLVGRFSNYYSLVSLKNKERSSIINNSILKYGHSNFSLDILEYCEPSLCRSREQYYLNLLKSEYNICKKVDSPLGVKRDLTFSINLSKARQGKTKIPGLNRNITPIIPSAETKLKMSARAGGVSVKIYDESDNFIKEFPTMSSAAKHMGVTHKTIANVLKTGKSYDSFTYKFEIKDIKIRVYDSKYKLVNVLDNTLKTSVHYNIPYTTLSSYIKYGKLYNNKYYFYKV